MKFSLFDLVLVTLFCLLLGYWLSRNPTFVRRSWAKLKWEWRSRAFKTGELALAISSGSRESVERLLELGTSVDIKCEDDNRPLHLAIRFAEPEIVDF